MKNEVGVIYSGDDKEFTSTIRFYQANLKQHTQVNIVTSGYDDRFMMNKTTYTISTYGDCEMEISFDDRMKATNFITDVLGIDGDIQWKHSAGISGYIDNRTWSGGNIDSDIMASIKAFLELRQRSRYTPKRVAELEMWLATHPIPDDVMRIVEYQLSECDRKNIQMWGHPNGQAQEKE